MSFTFDPSQFAEILSFHDGVAAVCDRHGFAYHIKEKDGEPLYVRLVFMHQNERQSLISKVILFISIFREILFILHAMCGAVTTFIPLWERKQLCVILKISTS